MKDLPPLLFSGSSNLELASQIAKLLQIDLSLRNLHLFPDKEIFVEILQPVQDRDTFIVQSLFNDPNVHLMELLVMADALKRAKARSITAILPYFGYARQDRMINYGTPITAKLVADLIVCAGINKVITLDLHSEQIEGFFDIPVDHLVSRCIFTHYCKTAGIKNAVIVAPDKGSIKIASGFSKELGWPMALIDKERLNPFHVAMRFFIGNVADKTVILTDDICSTAGTLVHAANRCQELGAKKIIALVSHALFVKDALAQLTKSPIEQVITTDSISLSQEMKSHPKIHVVSVASLFSSAIQQASSFRFCTAKI